MTDDGHARRTPHSKKTIESVKRRGFPGLRHWCALLSLHPESMSPIDDAHPREVTGGVQQFEKCRHCGKVALVERPSFRKANDE